jgi:hypothetical protein
VVGHAHLPQTIGDAPMTKKILGALLALFLLLAAVLAVNTLRKG